MFVIFRCICGISWTQRRGIRRQVWFCFLLHLLKSDLPSRVPYLWEEPSRKCQGFVFKNKNWTLWQLPQNEIQTRRWEESKSSNKQKVLNNHSSTSFHPLLLKSQSWTICSGRERREWLNLASFPGWTTLSRDQLNVRLEGAVKSYFRWSEHFGQILLHIVGEPCPITLRPTGKVQLFTVEI